MWRPIRWPFAFGLGSAHQNPHLQSRPSAPAPVAIFRVNQFAFAASTFTRPSGLGALEDAHSFGVYRETHKIKLTTHTHIDNKTGNLHSPPGLNCLIRNVDEPAVMQCLQHNGRPWQKSGKCGATGTEEVDYLHPLHQRIAPHSGNNLPEGRHRQVPRHPRYVLKSL